MMMMIDATGGNTGSNTHRQQRTQAVAEPQSGCMPIWLGLSLHSVLAVSAGTDIVYSLILQDAGIILM